MDKVEIPEGYRPIAIRDDRMGACVVSYHHSKQRFFFAIDGKAAGPFTVNELKALVENLKDVIELKGRFIFIDEYDVYGKRTI